jgi:hypothetical protein
VTNSLVRLGPAEPESHSSIFCDKAYVNHVVQGMRIHSRRLGHSAAELHGRDSDSDLNRTRESVTVNLNHVLSTPVIWFRVSLM